MNNTAPVYRVTVSNIGEVYAGNNAAEARARVAYLRGLIQRIETRHTATA